MKPNVFADTDVVLDMFAQREPFYRASARLFALAEQGEIRIFVSSLSFANLFYILRKQLSGCASVAALKKFKRLVTVLPVDAAVIDLALDSGFTDFEDASQHQTASAAGIEWIVTRNGRDYRKARLNVSTAEEFLAQH